LPFQQLAKKPSRRAGVTIPLNQNVDHVPILVDGSPQVVALALDLQEDLV
jgi:hypothetical protein